MSPLIAQSLWFLLRKGLFTYCKGEPGKRYLELSRCWKHWLAPIPLHRGPAGSPRSWPAGGPLVVRWAHALTRCPAPRADHRCEGRTGNSSPLQARLWASVVLLQGHGGPLQGQEGRGRLGVGLGGVGSQLPSPWPTPGHRRGEEGTAATCGHALGLGSGAAMLLQVPLCPRLRVARVGAQASSSLPSLESSFRFWAMSFICC